MNYSFTSFIKSILIAFLAFLPAVHAQTFNFQLTGNPVNTTGWNLGPQSYVSNDEVILTDNLPSQAGYIYFDSIQNLANCSQFTVTFDFKISNSSVPTADGIAFFYISNPPSAFVVGGGIGLPNNPDGLILVLDTYNNNGFPDDNPLISLRKMNGTSNYTEGTTTGQLASDVTDQYFIEDGNWHTCQLIYSFGTITVSFDNNPPLITANTTLNINGYFGFCAGTGALYSTQAIKNVSVHGALEPDPPVVDSVFYCQNETAVPLTATPDTNLLWYDVPTGGSPLAAAPTPNTTVPGVQTWYVSKEIPGCNIESERSPLVVTVHPLPAKPAFDIPLYCSGAPAQPITITNGENVQWYSQDTGGTGSATIPIVNTANADTLTWYATQTDSFGCESERAEVSVIVHQSPVADFDFSYGLACGQDTVRFQNNTTFADQYFWDFGDGMNDTLHNPQHIYTATGSYFVSLIADNEFCADTTAKLVGIGHPLRAMFTVSSDTICQGGQVDFTNTSIATPVNGIDPVYAWNFRDGDSSADQNTFHVFDQPGLYNVALIAQNSIPCYDTAYHTIVVDSMPQLSYTQSDSVICQGDKVIFHADLTQDGLNSLAWYFGDSPDSFFNSNPAQHSFDRPGFYTIYLNGQYRVCPGVDGQMHVRVSPVPVINLGPDTSLCLNGAPIVLEDGQNKNNPLASWRWNTGDTTASLVIRHDGRYTNTVTIDHCSATDEVVVKKDCYLDIPNSFTPNNDGENDYFLPRQLLSSGAVAFRMSIYNRWGEIVFLTLNVNGRGWDGTFNGKAQPLGVYIYKIEATFKNGRKENYTGNVTLLR